MGRTRTSRFRVLPFDHSYHSIIPTTCHYLLTRFLYRISVTARKHCNRLRRNSLSKSSQGNFRPSDRSSHTSTLEKMSSYNVTDILTAPPLELSMRALKYLTPVATISLRLVSKGYYDLLTSEEMCKFLSHQFVTPEYESTKAFPPWRFHYKNRASGRLAFHSGKPWIAENFPQTKYL